MSGTGVAKRKYDYTPLGSVDEDRRDRIINGALAMLAEDETLVDVAAHYGISKATLIAALTHYAEDQWKNLQVARAQVAVQRASQKRTELAAQLDEYQAAEKIGEKTTETALTYPRIREQLRIAEHDEKSAQWHLERLHRRLYGNSMEVSVQSDNQQYLENWITERRNAEREALGLKKQTPEEFAAEHDALCIAAGVKDTDSAFDSAMKIVEWRSRREKAVEGQVVSVEVTPRPTGGRDE
jgi:hypothetical protein